MQADKKKEIYEKAKKWVFEAGEIIRKKINSPRQIETKSNSNDLVTEMDKATEVFLVDHIRHTYPNHSLLSEEGYGDELDNLSGVVWIIDPIDGTMNFVHQKRNFAISIGIYIDGIGEIGLVYDVMEDTLYSGIRGEGAYKNDRPLKPLEDNVKLKESIFGLNHFWLCENEVIDEKTTQDFIKTIRGVRRLGSAALECCLVAEGLLDGYLAFKLSPWDYAAGIIIAGEVGAVSTKAFRGKLNMIDRSTLLVTNPSIQEDVLGILNKGQK